ncbi:MAG: ornithine cyclodeaminase [Actinobacteria bacterium]|nr:ornithine cyclodeaminase [Actinomycetota bacterium]
MTLLIRDADVRGLVRFPDAVEVVREGIAGGGAEDGVAERSTAKFGDGWLRVMSGTLPALDVLGFKAFALVPGVGVRYLCALYRLGSGEPLALLDANHLTVVRTSAAAAAAAAHQWGEAPLQVGVIGSGLQAQDGLRALASVCAIESVRVFSPTAASRERYADQLRAELGFELTAAPSAAAALAGARMALCATQTRGAVALAAADLPASVRYVSSVSSTLPGQRELDGQVIAEAGTVIVDTPDALEESGDLLAAREAGFDPDSAVALGDFLCRPPGSDGRRVVYKSIGSVEQDLAIAYAAYLAASRSGGVEEITPIEALKSI